MEVPKFKELINTKTSNASDKSSTVPKILQYKSKKTIIDGAYSTGKRKNSVARVWLKTGHGKITINNKNITKYFPRAAYRNIIMQPLLSTNTSTQYDVICTTRGGGTTGQAGAIVHGIAKALDCISYDFHKILKQNGLLTRDSRIVERKKYGKRKARKSAQFSKR